jgi:hypothetical protein
MSKCLVVLTFTEVESFPNGEQYEKRQHLGIALIKEDKSSNEIINLMRVGYPEQFTEEVYGVNSMLEQLPMLGVEVIYEETTKDMANRLLDEAKKLKIIYKEKVVTLAKFLNSRGKDYEVENTYNALVKVAQKNIKEVD